MVRSTITITVERQPDATWIARFAKSIRYSGKADHPGSAVSRLIDSFGWDRIELINIVEVLDARQADYRVFQVPLNASGVFVLS